MKLYIYLTVIWPKLLFRQVQNNQIINSTPTQCLKIFPPMIKLFRILTQSFDMADWFRMEKSLKSRITVLIIILSPHSLPR
jgi:hypothetical protein